jgi:hypothetical protein
VRSVSELLRVLEKFASESIVASLRIFVVHRNQDGESSSPLDVLEKLVAEPAPFVRPLDDSRDIGDDKGAVIRKRHHPQNRRESGKRVVRHPWARIGDSREKSRLSSIWLPDQSDIGEELEGELHLSSHPFCAWLPTARSLLGGGREAGIPPPTAPSRCNDHLLSVGEQLSEKFLSLDIANDRSRWDPEDEIVATLPRSVAPLAVGAAWGPILSAVTEVEKGRKLRVTYEDDTPTGSAIAP